MKEATDFLAQSGFTCSARNQFWDQTVAVHREAKRTNQEVIFPWKCWPRDHLEEQMTAQQQAHMEAFMQDPASWQAYKGSIWDAMRWALPSDETERPLWKFTIENKTMRCVIGGSLLFPEFWARVDLLIAVGRTRGDA